MKFVVEQGSLATGNVYYIPKDHAIQTIPAPDQAGSIAINEVELQLGLEGQVIGVSGYCPATGWSDAELFFPCSETGIVTCHKALDSDGLTVKLNRRQRWQVLHDPNSKVLCICETPFYVSDKAIGVINGLALALEDDQLRAIWIQFGSVNGVSP